LINSITAAAVEDEQVSSGDNFVGSPGFYAVIGVVVLVVLLVVIAVVVVRRRSQQQAEAV